MNTPYPSLPGADARTVYIRPVAVADLPEDIREQAEGREVIYALHGADGERLALAADRSIAFAIAEQNDLAAVNVH
ncbi:DUF1150 family protein [Szabonella alba]|uniref:DUF1150 family protein n=1 Tax=Szabonella alba TaxID=2804194 RepID=A0A8K0VA86_9RHOB|nr:DUF1150 family protein [Szabonella alba]MBL4916109.1 DUF1150 family protein [Szabonella alba]